ncbi:MAG: TlpA family protein disulfide reductase [Chitinophagaceae bacterium]|nr:MAG: TlpA family protein disulfide reductase [Chitinophagaceae bacterium]
MKQFLLVFMAFLLSAKLLAQLPANTPGTPVQLKLEEMVIKDSGGTIYPAELARRLLGTGKYILRMSKDRTTAFLAMLSDAEIEKRNASLPKPAESKFFKTGQKIASFSERDMKGNKFSLKELAGKVVVLNFWFINCPPCRMEIPQLNELVVNYQQNPDVVFIAVALDERYDIQEFLKTNPFRYNIIDGGRYIASKYNINLYPTHLVLDKEGKAVFHSSGYSMGMVPWIKKSIDASLAGTILP